jgi:hypothetical protein
MKNFLLYVGGIGAQELIAVLVAIVISLLIFLALRALILWYWKITAIVENQQKQTAILLEIQKALTNDAGKN